MTKILLIGTIPSPIGGISVHIDRFLHLYGENEETKIGVFDSKKRTLFFANDATKKIFEILSYFLKCDILHIHISNDSIKLLFVLLGKLFFKKVIYTHHNSIVKNKSIFRLMYWLCDIVILVNDEKIDTSLIIDKKTAVIPAFLPPYKIEHLPKEVEDILTKFDFVISTNCYFYNLFEGKHVYGFDLIVDAFYLLSVQNKIHNTLLLLVDPSNTTRDFVEELLHEKEFGSNKALYLSNKIDFVSLIQKSNITIRATRTDGDSLSVRESLFYSVPVIASDVVVRPVGTVLFRNENRDDLADKIIKIFHQKDTLTYESDDYGKQIIALYRESKIENPSNRLN